MRRWAGLAFFYGIVLALFLSVKWLDDKADAECRMQGGDKVLYSKCYKLIELVQNAR